MGTMEISVQNIGSMCPDIKNNRSNSILIQCDMDYRSAENAIAMIRENIEVNEWRQIIYDTSNKEDEKESIIDVHTMAISSLPPIEFEQLEEILLLLCETRRLTPPVNMGAHE